MSLFLAALLTMGATPARAQEQCYETRIGRWLPTPVAGQAPFLRLPAEVRISAEVGVSGPETGKRLARPAQPLGDRVAWAYWVSPQDEELEVVYVNDFGSVHLKLVQRPWGWIGDALAEQESGRGFRAPVRLVSRPCP